MSSAYGRFGRIISRGRQFIPEVDGLRFIAISSVLAYHLASYPASYSRPVAAGVESAIWTNFAIGRYGVQLFFVLSGFLLAMPFARWRLGLGKRPSLGAYYLRRLTRLEPPYVVSMILLFFAGMLVHGFRAGALRWPNLLASLVYCHNLIFGKISAINGVAWSLEIEVQFYMIAPFLAVLFSIRRMVVRRIVILSSVILIPLLRGGGRIPPTLRLPGGIGATHFFLAWHIEFFLAGFLLADLYLVDWKEAPLRSAKWDLVTLLASIALISLLLSGQLPFLVAPVVLLAYCGVFRGSVSSRALSRPIVTTIGGMCYSMYLLHSRIIEITLLLMRHILDVRSYLAMVLLVSAIAVPVVMIVTVVFFSLLERPCMDPTWPGKLRKRFRWTARREAVIERTAEVGS